MKRLSIGNLPALLAVLYSLAVGPVSAGTVTGLPMGPAFGGSPQLALTDGTVTNDGTNLDVTLNFSTPISSPVAFAPNNVFGDVLLDTDQSTATGLPVSVGGQLDNSFGLGLGSIPSAQVPYGLGVDYVVSLVSGGGMNPGYVDVISATTVTTLVTLPITYTSTSLSFSIPISALTDPVAVNSLVNFAAIVGNPFGDTDTLLGIAASSVPEPSTLTMAGLACACAGWFAWRCRSPRRTLPGG